MKKAILLSTICFALFLPGTSVACSPVLVPSPLETRVERADLVVKAVAVDDTEEKKHIRIGGGLIQTRLTTHFEVREILKGPPNLEAITVRAIDNPCSDDVFAAGVEYTLFLSIDPDTNEIRSAVNISGSDKERLEEMHSTKSPLLTYTGPVSLKEKPLAIMKKTIQETIGELYDVLNAITRIIKTSAQKVWYGYPL